ncbi:MAG: prepilin-type N-terminal cleavage/methylation domain-containing protein [Nitrospirae bacterium]|nr:prepilin-type N-terminal cleavage/methylation domain-containing protein [Nitrospirota bacterium]
MTYIGKNKGFTLLELLIVLFLATLMLGLSSVVFVSALPSSRLDAAAREVSATIRQARALAQIHGEPQTVTINLDSRQYGIEGRGTKKLSPELGIKVTDPFNGEVLAGEYRLQAHITGAVDGCTIVLWNRKKAVSIQTDPIVGAVVIK